MSDREQHSRFVVALVEVCFLLLRLSSGPASAGRVMTAGLRRMRSSFVGSRCGPWTWASSRFDPFSRSRLRSAHVHAVLTDGPSAQRAVGLIRVGCSRRFVVASYSVARPALSHPVGPAAVQAAQQMGLISVVCRGEV